MNETRTQKKEVSYCDFCSSFTLKNEYGICGLKFPLLRRMCVVATIHNIMHELKILTLTIVKTKKQDRLRSESDMHVALSVCVSGWTDITKNSEAHLPHLVNEQL